MSKRKSVSDKINIISNEVVEKITTELELPVSLYNPQIAEANIHFLLYRSFPDFIVPFRVFDEKEHVLQMQYCDKGTLSSIRSETMNDVLFLSIYCRVLWILHKINKRYPEFRHNDMHLNNIFLSYEPRAYVEYGKWKIPTFNYKVILGDFDRASITGIVDNYHIYYFQCFKPQLKYDSNTNNSLDVCVFTASFLAYFKWKLSKQLVNFITVHLYGNTLRKCVAENYYVPPKRILNRIPRTYQILFESMLFGQFINRAQMKGKEKEKGKDGGHLLVQEIQEESILVPYVLTDVRSHSQQYYEARAPKSRLNLRRRVKPDFDDIRQFYIEITSSLLLTYSLKHKKRLLFQSMVACEQFFRSQYVFIPTREYVAVFALVVFIYCLAKEIPLDPTTELLTPDEWADTFLNRGVHQHQHKNKNKKRKLFGWTGEQLLQCMLQYNWFRAFYIY